MCDCNIPCIVEGGDSFCPKCGAINEDYVELANFDEERFQDNFGQVATKNITTTNKSTAFTSIKTSGSKNIDAELNYFEKTLGHQKKKVKERSLIKGVKEIQKITKALNLNIDLREKIVDVYINLYQNNKLKGRHIIASIFALVVIVCNNSGYPTPASQILKDLKIITRKKYNKQYYYLYSLLDDVPAVVDNSTYCKKYLSFIQPSQAISIINSFLSPLLAYVDYDALEGRAAIVTLCTLVYHLISFNKDKLADKYLKKTYINRLTVKLNWTKLRTIYSDIEEKVLTASTELKAKLQEEKLILKV